SWVRTFDQDTYFAKIDWQIGPANQLSARWNGQRFTGQNLEASGAQNSFEHTGASLANNDTLAFSLTSTLSASVVNVARFGYVRSDEPGRANSPNPEAVVFEGGQLVLTIGRGVFTPRESSIRRGQWSDTLSYSRGRHLLKVGMDVLADWVTFFTAVNFSGSYRFNSLESFGRNLAGMPAPQPGERYIQAFSGEGTAGTTVHPDFVALGAFVQDEWRLRPNLTLNLGLRYDRQWLATVPVSNPSPALAAAGLDTAFTPADGNNLAPRFGFAWNPRRDNRLVVRGGYGIFYWYTPSISSSRAHFQNGITVQTRTFTGANIPLYPNTLCGPPDASGEPPSCPAPGGMNPPLLFLFDPEYVQPWAQQGSFGLEFELRKDLSISANYLWVHGTHLIRIRDINLGTPTAATTIGIAGTTTGLTFQDFALPRPIAGFDRISLIESNARSTYHGLALQASKRFSHNFQFLASYTLSKVIDDVPETTAVNPPAADRRLLSDPSNAQADRGPGFNDQRHRFVFSGIWQLNYAKHMSGWARAILDGWELSTIVTAQSGQPYSGLVSFDLNHDGNAATDRTPGLGRHTFNLPWQSSLDLRVMRNVGLGERARLQFLWEAFNLFNRANVTAVRTTQFSRSTSASMCGIAGTPCLVPQDTGLTAFGVPTVTAGPRILQLAVKLVF
ncbi:MAG: TonB-dependent receptor domain-containing protein, partial [Candidatus Acidiferrales bacterium]